MASSAVVKVDGSIGEGGGQVLRTAISLSAWTGQAVEIERIRAGRRKPGLRRQHLTSLQAAAQISRAVVEGDVLGSSAVLFRPGRPQAGEYRFSVGTAGSVSLVLQTVLPLLITASGESRLELEGGTHNPWAPPFEFLELAFLPLLNRMGPQVRARLVRHGFYPAGGGRLEVSVRPARRMLPLELLQRGRCLSRRALAAVARLPQRIAQRELRIIGERLGLEGGELQARTISDSDGPGNFLTVALEFEGVTEVFTGFGQRGVPAEKVAARTADEAQSYLDSQAPVGPYLADQLLLPMAMAGGGKFRTVPLTRHSLTNMQIVESFLDVRFRSAEIAPHLCEVVLSGQSSARSR